MPRQVASSGRGTKKPPVSNAARNQLIDWYDRRLNYKDFAKSMGINLKTASRIILDYIKTGKREALLRGGRYNVKVDDEMRAYLYGKINNNPSITLRKINEGMRLNLPQKPHVSDRCISQTLKRILLTTKQLVCNIELCPYLFFK